ncbi:hypothetical protein [Robertmurraya sp. P23]|uniref:hypothetical protein n=1 Tax=Robertmurraya sp. P23 TaxID=3436931 RepID=UPI003D960778
MKFFMKFSGWLLILIAVLGGIGAATDSSGEEASFIVFMISFFVVLPFLLGYFLILKSNSISLKQHMINIYYTFKKGKSSNKQNEDIDNKKEISALGAFLRLIVIISFVGFLFLTIMWLPLFLPKLIVKANGIILYASDMVNVLFVFIFNVVWFFSTLYLVKNEKIFRWLLLVPVTTYIFLFFNYQYIDEKGIHSNDYFQLATTHYKWDKVKEVHFVPSVYDGKRSHRTVEIQIAYLIGEEWYWINNAKDSQITGLKTYLKGRKYPSSYIQPLDKETLEELIDEKQDNKERYENLIKLLEVKDIKKPPAEVIQNNDKQ